MKKQLSVILIASLVFLASGSNVFAQGSAKKDQASPVERDLSSRGARGGATRRSAARDRLHALLGGRVEDDQHHPDHELGC